MKLIKQTTLYFQKDSSDKVYEVDLCEVGISQYLVNFRYGRRGTILKEGTKTDLPIDLKAAEKIYDKLVNAKTKKGYTTSSTPTTIIPTLTINEEDDIEIPTPQNTPLNPARIEGILNGLRIALKEETTSQNKSSSSPQTESKSIWKVLKEFAQSDSSNTPTPEKAKSNRPLSRLLWRVGELRLKEALPLVLEVKISNDPIQQYSLAWALGRIGDSAGLGLLQELSVLKNKSNTVSLLVREAKMALLSDTAKREMVIDILTKLPKAYLPLLNQEDEGQIVTTIEEELQKEKTIYWTISQLYLIAHDYPIIRQALIKWIKKAPLQGGGYFQAIRQLYKTAEFRDDSELYGIIAYRIVTSPPAIKNLWGGIYANGKYTYNRDEIKKPTSSVGFTRKTKEYLHRRFWRTLKRRGEIGNLSYIKMAVGFLLSYKDSDGTAAHEKTFWSYEQIDGRWQRLRKDVSYPSFSEQTALCHILFKNSPRYQLGSGRKQYISVLAKSHNTDFSNTREEAYPELWNKMPQGLMHLLAESQCLLVHEFASKAANANHKIISRLADVDFICLLLEKPYECTTRYALDLARAKYKPLQPDFDLTTALLQSSLSDARELGKEWVSTNTTTYFQSNDFIVNILFTPHAEISEWLDKNLEKTVLKDAQAEAILAKSIAKMLNYKETLTEQEQQALIHAGDSLKLHFQTQLYTLDLKLIHQLLEYPIAEVQIFGAKILLHHQTQVKDLPEELILKLMDGKSVGLRAIGVQLLGKLPKEELFYKEDLLVKLSLSPYPEIRKEIQPIITDLAKEKPQFADKIVVRLAPILLKKEPFEGRDKDLLTLLIQDLSKHLQHIDKKTTLNLLYSSRQTANQLGSHLLQNHIDAKDLTISQIVLLASNQIVAVRRWVWKIYQDNLPRIKYEAANAVRIMDAKWEDSRDFGFQFFDTNFGDKEWTPEILISLCDSVNPMVQQYGRNKITQFFRKEDGEQYLLQLSQHPSADLQSFATNYLDDFAKDKSKNIKQLSEFFTTVLSNINKSRVAKKRIFEFLKKEGLKDNETAAIIAKIIARQSATMAIADKAKCIEIMRDLQERHKDLDLPIVIKTTETYNK